MYKNPYIRLKPATQKPYTEIFLIRHCHPNYKLEKKVGEYNMPLSPLGLKQRKYLTQHLLKLKLDRVYSSGLLRAQETASEYLKKTGKKIKVNYRLDEIDWHDWHRIPYFNVSEKNRAKKLTHYRRLDNQLDSLQTTARRVLAELYHENRGKKIGVFTHGNFIKTALTGILNADTIGFLGLEIFQSSISKLVIDRFGYIKINHINDASHLPTPPQEDLFITLTD